MNYSIKDLEQLSGIKAHTLRIWEQRYNILQPKRTDTNIRYYDDTDLKLVLNISLLNENGYKISKIADMPLDEMYREVVNLTERNHSYPEQIQALTISMIDLDEDRFEKVMATNILHFGFEKTMINIVFPFLSKIGILWQTGAINPAHEHFITYLIRQKLIVAIDGQVKNYNNAPDKFMLFLPEGELHEISLLFASFLMKARNKRVIYLGQSLPFHDLVEAAKIHNPAYLFSIITTTPGMTDVQNYIEKLSEQFADSTILLSGYQVVAQDVQAPDNVNIIYQMNDLIAFLEE